MFSRSTQLWCLIIVVNVGAKAAASFNFRKGAWVQETSMFRQKVYKLSRDFRTTTNYSPLPRRLMVAGGGAAPLGGNSSYNASAALGAAGHGAHPSIFALGAHLDLFHATVCFCALVAFTIVVELAVHGTEHYLHHKMPHHYTQIFDKVIKGKRAYVRVCGLSVLVICCGCS